MSVSLSIGGVDLVEAMADEGHSLLLSNIGGRDPLRKEIQSASRPGASGSRFISATLPAREISVKYTLISNSRSAREAAGRLLGRLLGFGLERCEFTDQDGYYMAVASNEEAADQRPTYGDGTIRLWCPQPFLYGDETSSTPSGGLLLVNTNYFVEPEIRWTLSDSVGAAWVEVDGQRLTVDTGISEGQQVRIDCARKEVRVGGVLNVENISGVFPRVRDGSTVTTSPGGSLTFNYQERQI